VGALVVEEKITDSVERRLQQLESEVKGLKEPLEKTLFEVREVLNTLENPFTYISALLRDEGAGALTEALQHASSPNKESKPAAPSNTLEKEDMHSLRGLRDEARQPEVGSPAPPVLGGSGSRIGRFINVVAAVSLMLNLVGREQLLNIINIASWRGLISKQLADDVKEAIELYLRGDLGVQLNNLVTRPSNGVGNTLIVLYILSWLEKDPHDTFILILLTAFERNPAGQNSQRGY